jgi:flagellin
MRINTNVASLTAQEAATNTNKAMSSSLEKLGSGFAINKAADNASGLSIADKLRTQASSIGQGISNANSASALIQIADKAMSEQSNILDTVKQKLIQASTSTTNADGREAIRKDISKLLDQFDNIAAQTNYNGTTLLQKDATDTSKQDALSFQLGEDKTFDVSIQATKASNTNGLGGGSDTVLSAAMGAVPAGGTTQTDNNIDVAGSQQIKTSGSVTLTSVDITAAGTEGTASSLTLDIDVSGKIGSVTGKTGDLTFDAKSQSQDVQDAMEAIAKANANFTDNGDGTFKLANGNSVSFGDLDFSSMEIKSSDKAGTIGLNTGKVETTIVVQNNNTGTDNPLLGQINIEGGAAMTGGNLLADLKNLAENGLTAEKANDFMATVDEALTQLNANRSDFGSTQNQLESSIRNMQTTHTNLKAAESVIRDVDYAAESAEFNKQNIISQAGTYAMSQANAMAQSVQKLLQ